jgi:glycosyltransferase involved in cell wall biosynthesis
MRIAYVAHWDVSAETGVIKKITAQVQQWTAEGHEVKCFVVSPGDDVWHGIADLPLHVLLQQTFWKRAFGGRSLLRAVAEWNPDVLYLRYTTYYPVLETLVRRLPTVAEINSDDLSEFRLILPRTRYLLHRLTRSRLLSRVRGMVYVTGEISRRPYFTSFGKPSLVLGNGTRLSDYTELTAPANRSPRLAFMGTKGNPWHGVDEIIVLARACPEWTFDLIGYEPGDLADSPPPNVRMHGSLGRCAYEPILAAADVAIGSLALYRNSMNEGSVLKVREYLACGLPVIIAGEDTDFPDGHPLMLSIPNTPNGVTIALRDIRDFVERVRWHRVQRATIGHLDVKCKERRRLGFIAQVAAAE